MKSTVSTNLMRAAELVKLVFKDRLCRELLSYLTKGGFKKMRNGLVLAHQSRLHRRLMHFLARSSEFIVDRYLSIGDLTKLSKLLGLSGASFVGNHFYCIAGDSILCAPKELALTLAYQVRQIFLKKVYGSPTNSLVIDIGAWVGDSSIYFAKLGNYVIAVEPVAEYAKYIGLNAKLNNVEDRIRVINAAYSFKLPKPTCLEHHVVETGVPSGLERIDYVRLSDMVDELGESKVYLKVDCEGCEYDLVNELVPKYVGAVYGIAMEIHKEVGNYSKLLGKLSKYYKLRCVVEDDYFMIIQSFRKT